MAGNYRAYNIHNFRSIPQLEKLPEDILHSMEVVSNVLPFKSNSYIVEELIDWSNIADDPMFRLTFPQKEMLLPEDYYAIEYLLNKNADKEEIKSAVNQIRSRLNPHPAGQLTINVPEVDGIKMKGTQHQYRETVLFFPSKCQTCHAYCTFCFRWPQFVGIEELKFASKEIELLVKYIGLNPDITDVLFTGGDPLIMNASTLEAYFEPLLSPQLSNLMTIRIGSKALGYWPYRFLTDPDADDLLRLFEKVKRKGKHLAFMAHFNHPVELQTEAVKKAINRITATGAEIRTQSPILRGINDKPEIWADMWKRQVQLGCIPYYMFIARDTGAQHYFAITLIRAWEIFRDAYKNVSGICRTVRGPSMSCIAGKIQMLGVTDTLDRQVIVLRMLQGRNPEWVQRPFLAEYNPRAIWISDLKPAFGEEKFFFEEELNEQMNNDSFSQESAQFN